MSRVRSDDPAVIEAVRVAYVERGLAALQAGLETGHSTSFVLKVVREQGWMRGTGLSPAAREAAEAARRVREMERAAAALGDLRQARSGSAGFRGHRRRVAFRPVR
jgi:hypothetical protein